MEIENFISGRRAYQDFDYATTPHRQYYPSRAEAIRAMAGNNVAFRLYPVESKPGNVCLAILGCYVRIEREKTNRQWRATGKTCLASCQADAENQLGDSGSLAQTVSDGRWISIQTKQHLRAVGIKP